MTNETITINLNIVFRQMAELVEVGGYINIDTRNWDRILTSNQRFYYYQPMFKDDERINAMQVWDYNDDGTVTFNLLYSPSNQGI